VDQSKKVRIRIYNNLGQLIREIDLGRRRGKGVVYWDGRDGTGTEVPSGMYFYEVAGEGVRKMIVLR
jgi:flagellar hook assembly protein FlgD